MDSIINNLNENNLTICNYEEIINICNKKKEIIIQNNYVSQIYDKICDLNINTELYNFFYYLHNFNLYKYEDYSYKSYNIDFIYNEYKISLSYKISFSVNGVEISKNINLLNESEGKCYNLWGNLATKNFINLLKINISEEDINFIFTIMFSVFDDNIYW
jgi:hypothetical protein